LLVIIFIFQIGLFILEVYVQHRFAALLFPFLQHKQQLSFSNPLHELSFLFFIGKVVSRSIDHPLYILYEFRWKNVTFTKTDFFTSNQEIISSACLLCILLYLYPLMNFYHNSRWLTGRKEDLQEVISSSVCPTQFQSTSYNHFFKNPINSIIIVLYHFIDKVISVIPGNYSSDNCCFR